MEKAEFYREARRDRSGPLSGVRVVDITTAWAGPMVACVLADLGCDVVHVDLPASPGGTNFVPNIPGTSLSWAHQTVNRNKRSVAVDLHQPDGIELLKELVAVSDVVVQNFRPGTLDEWGIGYEHCRAVKADIIYVSVSGYGQFGPWSHRPGYDPAALAMSGWMSLNGTVDGPPNKAPTFLADDLAGLHGAIGALAALNHRRVTGEGQHVDVALLDSILFQSDGYLTLGALDVSMPRIGNQVGPNVPCNTYECSDGRYVYLAIALDSHWRKLTGAMDQPDLGTAPGLATNAQRLENRALCDRIVAEWCLGRSRDEVLRISDQIAVVAAPVETYHNAAREAHVLERDMLVPTVLSDGTAAPITGPAAKFSRTPTTVRFGAPMVGAHTEDVFTEIGIDAERLARLRADGVI